MITINLDCDGVLANFLEGACIAHNKPINGSKWDFYTDWGLSENQFWDKCKGEQFWLSLNKYEYALKFFKNLKSLCVEYKADLTITTAPSLDPESISAKIKWLKTNFNVHNKDIMLGAKKWILANPKSILIDDYPFNINKFNEYGGHGILFPQQWNCKDPLIQKYNWRHVIQKTRHILSQMVLDEDIYNNTPNKIRNSPKPGRWLVN